jgi:hypothetical protein
MRSAFTTRYFLIVLLSLAGAVRAAAFQEGAMQAGPRASEPREEFVAEIKQNFARGNHDALDQTAVQARYGRHRFPGAEWKLTVFYRALTWPTSGADASDAEWKEHLNRLQRWADQSPDSMTARIALGAAWVEYAKKARTDAVDWQAIDKEIGGKQYQSRLRQAEKALSFDPGALMSRFVGKIKSEYWPKTNTRLRSHCPHWYVVKLALEQGRLWEWPRYNNFFAEGRALEPTYYPLYETKAADLLPRNHGVKGQWEGFAENSANQIGSPEGDIAYYRIVAHVRPLFDNSVSQENFFRDHLVAVRRLIEGYAAMEERYGVTNRQMNEMALLLSLTREHTLAKNLFDRIGDNWDPAVWQKRAAFDGYRNLAIARGTPPKKPAEPAPASANPWAALKATLSSARNAYARSQDVVIQAMVENPSGAGAAADFGEIGVAGFTLEIQDARNRKPAMMLLPHAERLSTVLKPGELVDMTYRFNFALPPGSYKIRMKSLVSNELVIRIGRR